MLNLVNKEASDIQFEVSSFPDGQSQVKILDIYQLAVANIDVVVMSRLNNFKDLELICCAVASLKELKVTNISLYSPYFSGSRSDRKFEDGSNNYLKTVICPIINSLDFRSVVVVDPHSDVLEACLNNFHRKDNHDLVRWALKQINNKNDAHYTTVFVSPDGGALKKIYKVAEYLDFKGTIITCSKSRDNKGKLSKVNVPISNLEGKDLVIIDDICDGGATFINIAKEVRKHYSKEECSLNLVVTHGIFSKGFEELSKYFNSIYCTNSYSDNPTSIDGCYNGYNKDFVKQLNIF